MELLPQKELEQKIDTLFDNSDRLAFEALSKIVALIRKEEE